MVTEISVVEQLELWPEAVPEGLLRYLAGWLDADGSYSIYLNSGYAYPAIRATNTNPTIPKLIELLFGGRVCLEKRGGLAKPKWDYTAFGPPACRLAGLLLPFAGQKRCALETILDLCDWKHSQGFEMNRRLRKPVSKQQRTEMLTFLAIARDLNSRGVETWWLP